MLWLIVVFVVAIAFWAAGGLLFYVRHRTRRKVDLMRQTQTADASGVSALSPGTSASVPSSIPNGTTHTARSGRGAPGIANPLVSTPT